ncbi:MAG: SRPBCC family protein [Acidimicrobiia bacterium]|nr:SRPBCC family protein [Acidimicrobiia bacterium]
MHTSAELVVDDATTAELFEHVATLDRYPPWMRLVHRVEPAEPDGGRPAWWVELRGRIGPFARSKRLRMVRTLHEPGERVRFERAEYDERDHAAWTLTATVADVPGGARVVTDLEYTGSVWIGGALRRVLDDEIRRGRGLLTELVVSGRTR